MSTAAQLERCVAIVWQTYQDLVSEELCKALCVDDDRLMRIIFELGSSGVPASRSMAFFLRERNLLDPKAVARFVVALAEQAIAEREREERETAVTQ